MTSLVSQRSSRALASALLSLGGLMAVSAAALAQSDDASLLRGAVPDTTPKQRYQSAMREAGGGLKEAMQECRNMPAAERTSCNAQARSRYQADISRARAMLQDPSARPVNVVGAPIRTTESVYEIKN